MLLLGRGDGALGLDRRWARSWANGHLLPLTQLPLLQYLQILCFPLSFEPPGDGDDDDHLPALRTPGDAGIERQWLDGLRLLPLSPLELPERALGGVAWGGGMLGPTLTISLSPSESELELQFLSLFRGWGRRGRRERGIVEVGECSSWLGGFLLRWAFGVE